MKKHSILLYGHRTSLTLEPEFWQALTELAARQNMSIAALVATIDEKRTTNLSSAIRVFILKSLQEISQQNKAQ